MGNANSASAHRKRFSRWQSRAPRESRVLSELLESRITPVFEAQGFSRVGIALGRSDQPVDSDEIRLERSSDAEIDTITIWFDKYRRPRFQIGFSRRMRTPPNDFIRSAHLTKRSTQYFCFWGKPMFFPRWLWSDRSASREIDRIHRKIDQIVPFLEAGKRGRNIGIPYQAESSKKD